MIYVVIEDFDPEAGYTIHGAFLDLLEAERLQRELVVERAAGALGGIDVVMVEFK